MRLYVTTSQSGGEGQDETGIDYRTYIWTDIIGHTGTPLEIESMHPIGLEFIQVRIQLDFWLKK